MNVSTRASSLLQTMSAVLGVVLLFGLLGASPAAAQTTIEFNTNDQGIQPDETFTVPVTVDNLDQIASDNDFSNFDFEVDFSGVNATLDNVSFNNTLPEDAGMLRDSDVRTNDASISAAGTTPLEDVASGGSGVIARLEFTADATGGSGTVDLKNFNITSPLQVGDANADFDVTVAQNEVALENITVNQTGASDQTVVVDVTTSSLDGLDIQSFDLGIDFNSSVVTPTSDPIIKNGNASNFSFTDNVSGNTLSISSVTTSPGTALSGDGLLFQIEFNVEGTGTSNLPFSNVAFRDGSNNVENFAGVGGGVTVNVDEDPTFDTAVSSPQSTQEDQAASFGFTVTDAETANENLTLSASSNDQTLVPDGNISLTGPDASGAGTIDITPAANENGSADITITATDGVGNTATNTFTLNVTAVDDPPAAEDDSYTMDEDGTLRVSAPGVLDNDTHPDDDALTLSAVPVNDPSNGTVNLSTDGSFRYTPDADFAGMDQFTYEVQDPDGDVDEATVTITVEQINDQPTISAIADQTIDEDGEVSVDFTVDDVETDPSNLTITKTSSNSDLVPSENIEISGSGTDRTATVTPTADANGTATIELTVNDQEVDGKAAKDAAESFGLTVNSVNDPAEVATNEGLTLDEGATKTLTTADNLSASDVDDDPQNITFDVTTAPNNGELVVDGTAGAGSFTQQQLADGLVEYGHDGSETTSDQFEFSVTDDEGAGQTGQTFSITVNSVNDGPTISGLGDADVTIDEDTQTDPIGFTIGDPETDPSNLAITKSSGNPDLVPSENIEIGGSGADRTVTVTPSPDAYGAADITITVENGGEKTASQTFTVTVDPVNDAPTISGLDDDDPTTIDENTSAGPIEFTVDDVESDPSTLTVTATSGDPGLVQDADINVTGPDAEGVVSLSATPVADQSGSTDITVEVSDGEASGSDAFTLEVEAVLATISGSVAYPGEGDGALTEGRSLSGVSVEVSAVSGDMATTTTTDSDGNFSVEVEPGEYAVAPQIDRDVPSEINATDANRTIQAYLGNNPFVDPFQSEVADVNDSGNANATDALKMALFFNDPAGTTFEAGEWATTSETVTVGDESSASVSLQAAAYGDANLSGADQSSGSAVATNAGSVSPSAALGSESDLRGVEMEQTFEVPVRLSDGATLGSYSLQVDFPADKVSFEGVAETDRNVMSTAEDGTVRLSWFDQTGEQPVKLGSGASLVTLRFSAAEGVEKGAAVTPTVTAGELAGPDAQPLTSAQVSVEGVKIGSVLPDEFALQGSYPNPVSGGQATVEMDLPSRTTVTVEVYNTLGQRVQTIERSMAAGTGQTLQVDGSRLASGQYFYRVKADLEDGTAKETGRITVVR
jgi:hypothetical protein